MKVLQSISLPHRAGVIVAILAAVVAALLIISVTLIQSQRADAQTVTPQSPERVGLIPEHITGTSSSNSAFTNWNDPFTFFVESAGGPFLSGAVVSVRIRETGKTVFFATAHTSVAEDTHRVMVTFNADIFEDDSGYRIVATQTAGGTLSSDRTTLTGGISSDQTADFSLGVRRTFLGDEITDPSLGPGNAGLEIGANDHASRSIGSFFTPASHSNANYPIRYGYRRVGLGESIGTDGCGNTSDYVYNLGNSVEYHEINYVGQTVICATAEDIYGNISISDPTGILTVREPTTPSSTPVISFSELHDTGISNEDGLTNRAASQGFDFVLEGPFAAGAIVTLIIDPPGSSFYNERLIDFTASAAASEMTVTVPGSNFAEHGTYSVFARQSAGGVPSGISAEPVTLRVDRTVPVFTTQPAWKQTASAFIGDSIPHISIADLIAGITIDDIFTPAAISDPSATITYGKSTTTDGTDPSSNCSGYTYDLGPTLDLADVLGLLELDVSLRVCAMVADDSGNVAFADVTGPLLIDNLQSPGRVGLISEHITGDRSPTGALTNWNDPFTFFVESTGGPFLSGAVVSVRIRETGKTEFFATAHTLVAEDTHLVMVTFDARIFEDDSGYRIVATQTAGGTLSSDGTTLTGGISTDQTADFSLAVRRTILGGEITNPILGFENGGFEIDADEHANLIIGYFFTPASHPDYPDSIRYGYRRVGLDGSIGDDDCGNTSDYLYNLGNSVEYHEINYVGQTVICATVEDTYGNISISDPTGILTVQEPTTPSSTPVISFSGITGAVSTNRAASQGFDFDLIGPFETGAIVTLIIDPPGLGRFNERLIDFRPVESASMPEATVTVGGSNFAAEGAYSVFARQSAGGVPSAISSVALMIERTAPTFTTQPAWIATAAIFSDGLTIDPSEHALPPSIQDIFTPAVSDDPSAVITYGRRIVDIDDGDPSEVCSGYTYDLGTTLEYGDVANAGGKVRICARAVDPFGNTTYSDATDVLTLDIEVVTPTGVRLIAAHDTGTSDNDGITNRGPDSVFNFDVTGEFSAGARIDIVVTNPNNVETVVQGISLAESAITATVMVSDTALFNTEGEYTIVARQTLAGIVSEDTSSVTIVVDRTAPTFDVQPAWITTALVFADGFIRLDIAEILAGVNIDDIFTPAVTDDTEATIAYGKRNASTVASPPNDCGAYTYNLGSTLEYAEILQRDVILADPQEVRVCARAADAAGNFRISSPTGLLTLVNVPNPSSVGLIPEHDTGLLNDDGLTNRANTLPFDFFVRGNFLSGAVVSVELEKNDVIAGTYYTLVTENTNEVIVTVLPGVIERNGDLTVIGRHTVGGTLSADGRTLTGGISNSFNGSPLFGLSVSRARPVSFSRSPSFRVQTIGPDAHASLGIRDVFNDASNSAANTDGIDIIYGTRTSDLSASGDCANLNSYTYNLGTEVEYHEINYIGQIVVCAMVTNFHGNVRGSLQTGILTVEEPTNPAPTPVISFSELHDTGTLGDGITSRAVSQGFDFDLTGPFATGAIVTLIINPPGGGRDEFLVDFTATALVSGMVVTVPGSDFAANGDYTIRARQSDGGVPSHISERITLTIDRATPTFTTQPGWISTADVFSDGDGLMISPAEHAQLLISSSSIQDIFTAAVSDDPDGATITYAKRTAPIGGTDPDGNCSEYDYEDPVLGLGTSVEYGEISGRGKVRVCARVADAAGNTTYSEATEVLTADTEVPAPTGISLIADHDTGSDDSDGITNYAGAFTFDVEGGFSAGTRIDIVVTNPNGVTTAVQGTPLTESTSTARVTVSDATLFNAEGEYTLVARQTLGSIASEDASPVTIIVDRSPPSFTAQPRWIESASVFSGGLVINAQELLATGLDIDAIFTAAAINDPGATIAYGKITSTTSATPSTNCAADYDYNLGATLELSEIEEDGSTIVCASATDTAGNIAYSEPTEVLEVDLLLSGITYGGEDDTLTIPADTTRTISGAVDLGGGGDTLENGGDLLIRAGAVISNLETFAQTATAAILRIEIADEPGSDPVIDFGAADITITRGEIQIYYTGTWRAEENYTFALFATTGSVTLASSVRITDNDTDTDFDFIATQSGTDPVNLILQAVQTSDDVIDNSTSTFTTGDDAITIPIRPRFVISGAVDALSGDDSITNEGNLRLAAGASITNLETFTQTDANAILRIDIDSNPGSDPVFDFGTADINISNGEILINYIGDWIPADGGMFTLLSTTSATFAVSTSVLVTDSDSTTQFAYVPTQSGNNYSVLALLPPTREGTIPDQRIVRDDSVDIDASAFFASSGTLSYSASATAQNGTIAAVDVAGDTLTITGIAIGTTSVTITATDEAAGTINQTFSLTVLPPTLTAPGLAEESDTGTLGDGITSDNNPTFTGSNALPSADSVVVTARRVSSIAKGSYPLGEMVNAMLYPLSEDNIRVTSVSVALGTVDTGPARNSELRIPTDHLFGEVVGSDDVVLSGAGGGNSRPNIEDVIVEHDNGDGTFTITATLADGTAQTIRIYTFDTLENDQPPTAIVIGAVRLLDESVEASTALDSSGNYSADLTLSAQGLWEVTAVQVASGLTSITSPITSINLDSILPITVDTIAPQTQTIASGGTTVTDVAPFFSDESDLTYSAASNNEDTATAAFVGSNLIVSAVASGTAAIAVTAMDAAGNQSEQSVFFPVAVFDLVTPTELDLTDDSDSGVNDDNVTNEDTIEVTAQATADREVLFTATLAGSGDVVTAAVVAAPSGLVSVQFTNLAEGDWTITAAEIADGASSDPSTLQITIDRTAPETEGAIADRTAIMGGSGTVLPNVAQYFDPNDPDRNNFVFTVSSSNEAVATAAINAQNGIAITAGQVGTAEITLTATDTAGNQSTQSFDFVVIGSGEGLDPPDLDERDDTGRSNEDDVTSATNLRFSGTGPVGIVITVVAQETGGTALDAVIITAASDSATGAYSATLDLMEQGSWEVAAATQAVDSVAGLPALRVIIDTEAPSTQGSVDTQTVVVDTTVVVDQFFMDATSLTYQLEVADASIVTASLTAGNDLQIMGLTIGSTTVTVTAEDLAGNSSQPETFDVVVVPPALPRPTLENDTGDSDTDGITMDTEVTIGGTARTDATSVTVTAKAVGSTDIRTANGLVEPNGDYEATLTLSEAVWEVTAVQVVAGLTSAPSTPLTVTVDETPPATTGAIETQIFRRLNSTITLTDITRYFVAEPVETFGYSADADNASITTTLDADNNLVITVSTPGTSVITVTATDIAGNEGRQEFNVAVHLPALNAPPDLETEDDSGVSTDDNITNQSELTFTGSGVESSAESVVVTAVAPGVVQESIETSVTPGPGGTYSATLTLNAEGVWEITAAQVAGGLTSAASTALTVTFDETPPATTGAIETQVFRGLATPITLSDITRYFVAEAGEEFAYSATAASNTAELDDDNNLTITARTFRAGNGTVIATDTAGNQATQTFNVDVYPTAPGRPVLDHRSDSGDNSDHITKETRLSLRGSGLQPGITVVLTAVPNSEGDPPVTRTFSAHSVSGDYVQILDLSEGVWNITATQIAEGGLESPESSALTVTIDTTGPEIRGTIPTHRTLRSNSSTQIIADVTQFFSSAPGDTLTYTVNIFNRVRAAGLRASLDSNMNLNVTTFGGPTAGRASVQIEAADVADNSIARTVNVTVILGLPDLASSSDTGSSNSDDVTNQTQALRISGMGAAANANVTLRYGRGSEGDTTTVSTQQADINGRYSYELNLTQGTWFITAFQSFNSTPLPDSPTLTVTVDTIAPTFTNQIQVRDLHAAVSDGFLNGDEDSESSTQVLLAASAWTTNDNASAVTVTQYLIGRNADDAPVVCDGTYATQDRTLPSLRAPGPTTDLLVGNINYEPNDDDDFGNHYICALATDRAGNVGYSNPVGPIVRDTTTPRFERNRPAPGTETGRIIDDSERRERNIIDVGNTHDNDLIAFAVRSTNATCDADFGDFTTAAQGAQFDASDLISEGNNYVCIRLTDEAGNAPDGVFDSTLIMRNFESPEIAENIPNQILSTGEPLTFRGVSGQYFRDTNDTLTIKAESNNTDLVRVVEGSGRDSFTLEAVAVVPEGGDPVVITVTATDRAGQTAEQKFEVTVTSGFDIEFPELPDGSSIDYFVVVEFASSRPAPPRGVRFPGALYDITPQDSNGDPLEDVTAEVCLPIGRFAQLGNLAVYHFADGTWERLQSYVSEDGSHICAKTDSFSIFALGLVVVETVSAGLLPPTGGITPNIWVIIAAAIAGSMTLVAGAALGLIALSRRTTRKSSGPIT